MMAKELEESSSSTGGLQTVILDGEIVKIKFGLASQKEICTASISDFSINHSSQLTNPFLGLPLQFGKCESCGTSEPGQCEGHFGYIELPVPIYHPSHIGELKQLLSQLCLKCLKLKNSRLKANKNSGVAERLLSCCEDASQVSIRETKTTDGACFLQLKVPSKSVRDGTWKFMERYGFRYGDGFSRTLLPCEVGQILKKLPPETKKKLARKGYFPQDGYVLQCLPVPPNCLSMPDVSDGFSVMSTDLSISMLKKILKQVELIKSSRSGAPNFESHEVEANDLQVAVDQYLQVRGTAKGSGDAESRRFGGVKESAESSTKAWLEKMRTLFIRKGCGFSSRSVITGDAYKKVNEIGIPYEIAQKITFEERVNAHNMKYLQELVDNKLCLTYRDGSSTYSLREGSKGHTFLRPGQVVHRRIMDGDTVFINRPPTTHKHSLQALSVYVHDDHTVKINPLICGPLSADFDGDCIHLFYPQSLAAKAEVLELFAVEKQLLSSHTGNLNLQFTSDSLLSLKTMFDAQFLGREFVQQLAMYISSSPLEPAVSKINHSGPRWTALQMLQTALPAKFECSGDNYLLCKIGECVGDFTKDNIQSVVNEIVASLFFKIGAEATLNFFDTLQPLLMEYLFSEGFSVGLEDFSISKAAIESTHRSLNMISPLLFNLRQTYNELVEQQFENDIRLVKLPVASFIRSSSALGQLVDSKSDSSITKVVQQVGFLGLQLSDRGKFYSKTLVEDVASHFELKYPHANDYPSAQHGLIRSCFFHGLDPYEEIVHSISSREVIVRSSRGLAEPGTLFKNLMAILRDVVICYDGTVRNVCSNSIIQFDYGAKVQSQSLFPAGEPVGVLAATAMSTPAYRAVLDSTPSSNSSWELMKEILLCKVNFKNDIADRRVILYLNSCNCGRKCCPEKGAYLVKNHLEKVRLKDIAESFVVEYEQGQNVPERFVVDAGLVGHIHLNKSKLDELNISMRTVLARCQEILNSFRRKKKFNLVFQKTTLNNCEFCSFHEPGARKSSANPCLTFFCKDSNDKLSKKTTILTDIICPVLLDTIIKGDNRVSSVNIIWVSPDTTTWIRNPYRSQNGELALDVTLEKSFVKQSGDAWRIVMDSCLPILHLIDTTRSIPYAIKQLQELLGVSCAFHQAVQRLSTSVTMVSKGLLKEHLLLLANSMTCTGNLVGFNSGGFKALARSLDVQVPFTEATLYTPRKCFERAAEKCYVDTLSSIVASCSWGKRVTVGTGSRFDLLWDTKEACFDLKETVDVYSFLDMVRGSDVEELEDDDLILEERSPSPEHEENSEKPFFDDMVPVKVGNESNLWDSSGWNAGSTEKVGSESNGWISGGWNTGTNEKVESQSNALASSGWNGGTTGKVENQSNAWNSNADATEKVTKKSSAWDSSGWNAGTNKKVECQSNARASSGWNADTAGKVENKSNVWNSDTDATEKVTNKSSAWDSSGWNSGATEQVMSDSNAWNTNASASEKPTNESNAFKSSGWSTGSSRKVTIASDTWNSGTTEKVAVAVASNARNSGANAAEKPTSESNAFDSSAWNAGSSKNVARDYDTGNSSGWNSGATEKVAGESHAWRSNTGAPEKVTRDSNSWSSGGQNAGASEKVGIESDAWNSNAGTTKKVDENSAWNSTAAKKVASESKAWSSGAAEKVASEPNAWNLGAPEKVGSESNSWSRSGGKEAAVEPKAWNSGATEKVTSEPDSWNSRVAEKITNQSNADNPSGWNTGASENVSTEPDTWNSSGRNASPTWKVASQSDTMKASVWDSSSTKNVETQQNAWNSGARVGKSVTWHDNTSTPEDLGKDANPSPHVEPSANNSSWVKEKDKNSDAWGSKKESFKKSRAWGTSPAGDGSEGAKNPRWGQKSEFKKNRPEGSRGWESSGLYTVTRQRLDIFTSEEQTILTDVEPMMQAIRRIMHNPEYTDGEPLLADDQSYVLDNILNHHPDKAAKMGTGINFIMISKHSSFQDSRCFYIVSTDGSKQDFSSRKCLESYVRGKFPELAEEFIGKYFARNRPGGNRQQQNQAPAESPKVE